MFWSKKKKKLQDLDLSWFKESLENENSDLDDDLERIAVKLGITKDELDLNELIDIINLKESISKEDLKIVEDTVEEVISQALDDNIEFEPSIENYIYFHFPSENEDTKISHGLRRIIFDSTEIISKTENIDVLIERYELIKNSLEDHKTSSLNEFFQELDDKMKIQLSDQLTFIFSQKLKEANSKKTFKGKARNIIKVIKYYEQNINNIPKNLRVVLDNLSIVSDIEMIKNENSEETKLIIDSGVDLPEWWK